MKKSISILFAASAALLLASCNGAPDTKNLWQVQSIKVYDANDADGYAVRTFTYDEEGRVTDVVSSGYEKNGDFSYETTSSAVYDEATASIWHEYGTYVYTYEKGLIDAGVMDNPDADLSWEEHYTYTDGLITESWTECTEFGATQEYEWEDGNIVTKTGYSEGCATKVVSTFTEYLDNYAISILDFIDDPDITLFSLPGAKAMRSRCLPASATLYDTYLDENDEEVTEFGTNWTYSYEVDDLGRVTKLVRTISGDDWYATRTMELTYAE